MGQIRNARQLAWILLDVMFNQGIFWLLSHRSLVCGFPPRGLVTESSGEKCPKSDGNYILENFTSFEKNSDRKVQWKVEPVVYKVHFLFP